MDKDTWLLLPIDEKKAYVSDRLKLLIAIRTRTHDLSGTKEQGRLRELKKKATLELEELFNWENNLI